MHHLQAKVLIVSQQKILPHAGKEFPFLSRLGESFATNLIFT
jgi:hypothetical protein